MKARVRPVHHVVTVDVQRGSVRCARRVVQRPCRSAWWLFSRGQAVVTRVEAEVMVGR